MTGMLDRGLTADLLEERLMLVESQMPGDTVTPAAMRSAMRHLREGKQDLMYSLEEVKAFRGALDTGAEIACYMETKGFYKPEACIVFSMHGDSCFVRTSSENITLGLEDYNRKWRLWAQYPGGHERREKEWAGAQA